MGIRRLGRFLGRLIILGLGLWALTLVAVIVATLILSQDRPLPAPADAIICLGAGLSQNDQRLPDPASDRRAQGCATLHAAGLAPVVIFTGFGAPGFPVAEAMAQRAIDLGLPPDAALREPEARSTIQNAAYSVPLLPRDTRRVIVVSDAFHLPRAWAIFRVMGLDEVAIHVAPPAPEADGARTRLTWMLRETLAIWFNGARAAVYGVGGLLGIDSDTRIGWFN